MKHQVYNGYSEDFSYVCRQGESDVWQHVNVALNLKSAKTRKFLTDLESYGYDIYNPSDGFNLFIQRIPPPEEALIVVSALM